MFLCIAVVAYRSSISAGRRPPGGKRHDGIYTTDGVPTCLGQVEMEYIRTDPDIGHHLYRCPAGGCARQQTVLGYAAGGDEAWEDPEQDIRGCGHIGDGVVNWRCNRASANPLARHEGSPAQCAKPPPRPIIATTYPTASGTSWPHCFPAAPAKPAGPEQPPLYQRCVLGTPHRRPLARPAPGLRRRLRGASPVPPLGQTPFCRQLLEAVIDEPDLEWLMTDANPAKVYQHGTGAVGGNQAVGRT